MNKVRQYSNYSKFEYLKNRRIFPSIRSSCVPNTDLGKLMLTQAFSKSSRTRARLLLQRLMDAGRPPHAPPERKHD
ncbi:hypothetical protein Y032_0041g414 [Ancylostoma ceylanicum]|nr:hypothetical protein Y032_0041g414 [Ancylostoma ceylanicum]